MQPVECFFIRQNRKSHAIDEKSYKYAAEIPEGKRPLRDLGIDVRMVLRKILNIQDVKMRSGLIWLRTRSSGGFLLTRK
jgi:hypothetical protein